MEDQDDYHESSDEDFDATAHEMSSGGDSSSSEDDIAEDANTRPKKKRKISGKDDAGVKAKKEEPDLGELDSGDEATIRRAKRIAKKGKGKAQAGEGEDEWEGDSSGGEGGFVRTRGMRAKERVEKKARVNTIASSIDVDKLWAEMNSPGWSGTPTKPTDAPPDRDVQMQDVSPSKDTIPSILKVPDNPSTKADEETITVHRTYKFAGETHTETRTVPASSAEAKLYLSSQPPPPPSTNPSLPKHPPLRRPLRRISAFDPNPPTAYPRAFSAKTASTHAAPTIQLTQLESDKAAAGPKLNTVEKSKLDWAGFVDQEGIQDELVRAGRSKGGFVGRRQFLEEVERRKDEEAREARRIGRVL